MRHYLIGAWIAVDPGKAVNAIIATERCWVPACGAAPGPDDRFGEVECPACQEYLKAQEVLQHTKRYISKGYGF